MNEAYHCAVRLLARREHGLAELTNKLSQKGYTTDEIQTALVHCQHLGLQSDARFAESIMRTRVNQGYGPIRIRQELQAKQVAREYIDAVLEVESEYWLYCAQQVWKKKFISQAVSFRNQQKQKQFLLYRGFPIDVITQVVREQV